MAMSDQFRVNNFDLIRLIAALQVAIYHTMHHFHLESDSVLLRALDFVPGVPVFFFVSGFLISRSFESNSNLPQYTRNRALRIFPALIMCTVVAFGAVVATGYMATTSASLADIVPWLVGQMTFVQFYNPDFMREFGTGVLNGSLWTITVELQFYVMVPVLYALFALHKKEDVGAKLALLAVVFLLLHLLRFALAAQYGEHMLYKLFSVSFAPWIYMFVAGIACQKYFEPVHKLLAGRALYCLAAYAIVAWLGVRYLGFNLGNGIHPLLFVLLCATIFSCAYTQPRLGRQVLRGNDISYGVYIYHVPIINVFLYSGVTQGARAGLAVLVITVVLAMVSWFFVEKPSLKRKRNPLLPQAASRG